LKWKYEFLLEKKNFLFAIKMIAFDQNSKTNPCSYTIVTEKIKFTNTIANISKPISLEKIMNIGRGRGPKIKFQNVENREIPKRSKSKQTLKSNLV